LNTIQDIPDVLSNWCFVVATQTRLEELMLCVVQVLQAAERCGLWCTLSRKLHSARAMHTLHFMMSPHELIRCIGELSQSQCECGYIFRAFPCCLLVGKAIKD